MGQTRPLENANHLFVKKKFQNSKKNKEGRNDNNEIALKIALILDKCGRRDREKGFKTTPLAT